MDGIETSKFTGSGLQPVGHVPTPKPRFVQLGPNVQVNGLNLTTTVAAKSHENFSPNARVHPLEMQSPAPKPKDRREAAKIQAEIDEQQKKKVFSMRAIEPKAPGAIAAKAISNDTMAGIEEENPAKIVVLPKPLKQVKDAHGNVKNVGKWAEEEDKQLRDAVAILGESDWVAIAEMHGLRSPAQCRERWTTYLAAGINVSDLSPDELKLLKKILPAHVKSRKMPWSKIAKEFPGRTGNVLKNAWKRWQNAQKATTPIQRRRATQNLLNQATPSSSAVQASYVSPPSDNFGPASTVAMHMSHTDQEILPVQHEQVASAPANLPIPAGDVAPHILKEDHIATAAPYGLPQLPPVEGPKHTFVTPRPRFVQPAVATLPLVPTPASVPRTPERRGLLDHSVMFSSPGRHSGPMELMSPGHNHWPKLNLSVSLFESEPLPSFPEQRSSFPILNRLEDITTYPSDWGEHVPLADPTNASTEFAPVNWSLYSDSFRS